MSRWSLALALVAVLALAGFASAAKAGKSAAKGAATKSTVQGSVVKVDGEKLIIQTKTNRKAAGEEKTIETGKDTKVTVDGKEGKLVDLTAGMNVKVTPATGKATKIVAKSKKVKPGKNANNVSKSTNNTNNAK